MILQTGFGSKLSLPTDLPHHLASRCFPTTHILSMFRVVYIVSDFLLASLRIRVVKAWIVQTLPIGLDHRCVHCLILIGGA